ncbi:MAG: DoxX family protein [Calditrichota bacterium]
MKDKLADFALLWLRVTAGLGLMIHGWLKLSQGVAVWADKAVVPLGFPVPMVFAWLAVATEVIGGFFLILGLWTRFSALMATILLCVAAFGRGAGLPYISPGNPSKELALAYLVVVVSLLMTGPGRFSVDSGKRGGGGRATPKKSKK